MNNFGPTIRDEFEDYTIEIEERVDGV